MSLKGCIEKLLAGVELDVSHLYMALDEIMKAANPEQVAAFLVLLRQKGETAIDIMATVHHLRSSMVALNTDCPVLDIVGTGGDGYDTVNISTASAMLAASCGVTVLKHGNRSVSSQTGSADLMEAFGYNLDLDQAALTESLQQHHFGFCYAPNFHPAFAAIKPIRKRLAVPTIFNLVGPLLNPAKAQYMLMGVGDKRYLTVMAEALRLLGVERALVFNGCGLDEVSTVGPVDMIEIQGQEAKSYSFDPMQYGFSQASIADLQGGDAATNQALIQAVLQGESNAIADTLVLNAGLACYIFGLSDSIESGIALAKEKQASGAAYELLQAAVAYSKRHPGSSETAIRDLPAGNDLRGGRDA